MNVEKARNQKHDINKISDQDLAAMRKENPQQFDKIVLGRENPVSDPEAVVNNVIDRAIQKLEEENGIKVDEKRIKKFKAKLSPALSKLDPEYLKGQSDIISSEIQQALYDQKSIGYYFGRNFSVSTSNLATISDNLTAQNQERSDAFGVSTIRSSLMSLASTNTQMEERLSELAVEKAREVKYTASSISSEQLLEMRKENPARFDRIVLGTKQKSVGVVREQEVARGNLVQQARAIGDLPDVRLAKAKATQQQLPLQQRSSGRLER